MREQHGAMMEDLSGRRFGNYSLESRIDFGGMGEVYLARQLSAFNRKVAVKIIRSDLVHDMTARARFLREAEVSSYLKHEHILPLFEFGSDQGRLFIVTPYIEGGTLAHRLESGPMSLSEVHQLFVPLVQAVAYIHRRGVIHRDLKPTNVLLDSEDGQIYVRLIDFGIASVQGQAASPPLTRAGNEVGTIAYMAPERLSGVAAPSNDIFSLGIILYQMLTGHFPSPQPNSRLPRPLEYVVRKCIEPRPEDRFASAEEVSQVFERAYQFLVASPSVPPPAPVIAQSAPPQGGRPQGPYPSPHHASSLAPMEHRRQRPSIPLAAPLRPPANRQPAVDDYQDEDEDELMALELVEDMPELESLSAAGFKQADYGAPTASFSQGSSEAGKQSVAAPQPGVTPPARPPSRKRRGRSLLAIISTLMVVVLVIIAGILYYGYQTVSAASVAINFGPKTQVISQVFTIKADPAVKTSDASKATVAAGVFKSSSSGSKTGPTTGQQCVFGIFDCHQAVSQMDVDKLAAQEKEALATQITQDLQGQMQRGNAHAVGTIYFTNPVETDTPVVGTVSTTVTVTLKEQGSVEYFANADVQSMARQLLTQQALGLGSHYLFPAPGSTMVLGAPVIEGVDSASGVVTIKMAAGGVAEYQFPAAQLQQIKEHLKGLTVSQARVFLAQQPGVDPQSVAIHFTQGGGDKLPTDVQQITLMPINPAGLPAVNLPAVPTAVPTTATQ